MALEVLVVSRNKYKTVASEESFSELFSDHGILVHEKDAESEIDQQPYKRKMTLEGARNRADNAVAAYEGTYDYVVAIESGLIPTLKRRGLRRVYEDKAIAVVRTSDGREAVGVSRGVEFPKKYVRRARALPGGFAVHTVGSVIAQATGCDAKDPQSYLTRGRIPRMSQLKEAVRKAILHLQASS